jgi:hypothetical protein
LPDGIFSYQKPSLVYFGRPWNGKCWNVLWPFGIFDGHLVSFMAIILCTATLYRAWSFGIFCGKLVYFPVLVPIHIHSTKRKSGSPGVVVFFREYLQMAASLFKKVFHPSGLVLFFVLLHIFTNTKCNSTSYAGGSLLPRLSE